MPDLWSHILFGDDTLNSLNKGNIKSIIPKHQRLFNLGCQGPDIFLYNIPWPELFNRKGPRLCTLIHDKNTGSFLTESLKYLKYNAKTLDDMEEMLTYITGYMCHFALDRNIHPYVYYRTNWSQGLNHIWFEGIIGSILLQEKKGMNVRKARVYEELDIGGSMPLPVLNCVNAVLINLFKLHIGTHIIDDSYRATRRTLKTIHNLKCTNLLYPPPWKGIYYYMNRDHSMWKHPCMKEEIHYESIDDLYLKASREARGMMEAAEEFLSDRIGYRSLRYEFPDISCSTGKPDI